MFTVFRHPRVHTIERMKLLNTLQHTATHRNTPQHAVMRLYSLNTYPGYFNNLYECEGNRMAPPCANLYCMWFLYACVFVYVCVVGLQENVGFKLLNWCVCVRTCLIFRTMVSFRVSNGHRGMVMWAWDAAGLL